jgi:peptide/nickel transport system substrate-binding protein
MSKTLKQYSRVLTFALVALMLSMMAMPATRSAAQAGGSMNGHAVAADFLAYWNAHGGLPINGLPITDERAEVSLTNGQSYPTQWFERARFERHAENQAPFNVLLGLLGTNQAEGRSFDVATDTSNTSTHAYFPQTKHSLSDTPGPFMSYWQGNGGLAQFGYPLSEQISEVSTDGKTYTVQYFERQRFEFHPEQSDPKYKVLLGLLGVQQYQQQFVAKADVTSGLSNSHNTITLGMSQEPDTLFSPNANAYVAAVALAAIENGLIGIDDKNVFYPDLAAFIPGLANGAAQFVGADGPDQYLQIKWKLRKGIKWADGTEFTAKDVVYGWQGIYENANVQVVDRTAADKYASFTAVDDYTVVGKMLSENQATALFKKDKDRYGQYETQKGPVVDPLFFTLAWVYPEHAYGKLDATKIQSSDYGRNPLGTGPYKVRQWVAGEAVILEPNPNYNLTPNKPAFSTVTLKIVADTNQLLAQVQTGQIDIATEDATSLSQVPQLDEIAQGGKVKPFYTPSATWEHVDFNLDNPLFKDKNVRQAFAYAINRQQIVDKVLFGKTVVAHSWITPNITQFYNPDVPKYAYNPDKARTMLAAAGYTAGSDGILSGPGGKMSFKYNTTAGNAYRQSVTQLVAADLKAVGIDAQLEYIPAKQYFGPDGPLTRRTFAFAEYAWVSAADPGGQGLYGTSGIPSAANGYTGQNYPGWSNAQNDKLLQDANAVKEIALDPAKRAAAYKAEQVIFATELPVLPLHVRLNITTAPVGLKNYKPTGTSTPPTWNIQEWRW